MLTLRHCCCLFLALCPLAAAEELPANAKTELEKLQGEWVIVSAEREGKAEPQPTSPTKITIQEDKLLINSMEVGLRITMLSVESSPKLIDISHPETKKVIEGIYELKDQEWIVCINSMGEGAAERPANFKTADNIKFVKVTLKRM
jgi:uncharacterized protein (TIGR03067 family)